MIGRVVKLKAINQDNPEMVITDYEYGTEVVETVKCIWFDKNGNIAKGEFPFISLEFVEKKLPNEQLNS